MTTSPTSDAREFSAREVAALRVVGLPTTKQSVSERARREGWPFRVRHCRGGTEKAYPVATLPPAVRAAVMARLNARPEPLVRALGSEQREAFTSAPERQRGEALRRAQLVDEVRSLVAGGSDLPAAVHQVAQAAGVHSRTIRRWLGAVASVAVVDPALLVPRRPGPANGPRCICPDAAWDFFLSDYLRPSKPALAACYRRLQERARRDGWDGIPSKDSLRRRLEREVPTSVRDLRREGERAIERAMPAQRRDKSGLRALDVVNADGHKLDVFVSWPMSGGKAKVLRPVLHVWQDVYSGKILSWRLDEHENNDAVRLSFADLMREFGIPRRAVLDNGHAFACKDMTGGLEGRRRFGSGREDDVDGVYRRFGIEVSFATPYHGQAKPIERAFRDLAEDIARSPECAGAYAGNAAHRKPSDYGSRALPIDALLALVRRKVTEHNARPGRTSPTAAGRSFDETFAASYADAGTVIRRATEEQITWLLHSGASKRVRADSTVEVLGNRFYHLALVDLRGRDVEVRYDPTDPRRGVFVFAARGEMQPVCFAPCVQADGFTDRDAARRTMRARRADIKHVKARAEAFGTVPVEQLVDHPSAPEATSPRARRTKVVAPLFGSARPVIPPAELRAAAENEAAKRLAQDKAQAALLAATNPFDRLPTREVEPAEGERLRAAMSPWQALQPKQRAG